MKLLNYFYKSNKTFIYTLIALFIIFVLGSTIFLSYVNIYHINPTFIENNRFKVYFIHDILLIINITFILVLSLMLIQNSLGKKRSSLISFFGKNKYLIYILTLDIITFLLVLFSILIFALNISVFKTLITSYTNEAILNLEFSVLMPLILSTLITGLICNIIFFIILYVKELLKNSKYKYATRSNKVFVALRTLIIYSFKIFIFIKIYSFLFLLNMINSKDIFFFNFISINTQSFILILILFFVLLILDYIKLFKENIYL